VPGYANPQALNRYSYVLGNPLKYIDPSGHNPECGPDGVFCDNDPSNDDLYYPMQLPAPQSDPDDDSPGHDYDNDTLVCPAWVGCNEEEMMEYLTHFQYPGQWPWSPVIAGNDYIVAPARFWNIPNPLFYLFGLEGLGAIRITAENNDLMLINRSQETHIFHEGLVERALYQDEHGAWHVATHGIGTNVRTPFGWANNAIDFVNDKVGEPVFTFIDLQMTIWIATDQAMDAIRDAIP
jgi:hypothetical protein